MERSVKTDLNRLPTFLFHVGIRFQSARAAWRSLGSGPPSCQVARLWAAHAAAISI